MLFFILVALLASISIMVEAIISPCAFRSTPTFGLDGAVFTVCANATIKADAHRVFDTLLDFKDYYKWDQFTIDAKLLTPGPLRVGSMLNLTTQGLLADPTAKTYSEEKMTVINYHNFTAAWGDFMVPGLDGEHVSQLTRKDDGTVFYDSWETYYGPTAASIYALYGAQLEVGFQVQASNLKTYEESRQREKMSANKP